MPIHQLKFDSFPITTKKLPGINCRLGDQVTAHPWEVLPKYSDHGTLFHPPCSANGHMGAGAEETTTDP
jgi:hypothetical protein